MTNNPTLLDRLTRVNSWGWLLAIWEWLLTANVLETLFDGLLGAAVGAAVAMLVLKRTIRQQSRQFTAQLDKQDEHHQEQLAAQNRHHEAQIVKQDEALYLQISVQEQSDRRTRITQVAGELLAELTTYLQEHISSVKDGPNPVLTSNRLRNLVQRLYFDLDEEGGDFYDQLYPWMRYLIDRDRVADLVERAAGEHGEDLPDGTMESIREHASTTASQVGWLTAIISSVVRSGPVGRAEATKDLEQSLAKARIGDEAWLKAYPPNTGVIT
jgi:hypothetical protein